MWHWERIPVVSWHRGTAKSIGHLWEGDKLSLVTQVPPRAEERAGTCPAWSLSSSATREGRSSAGLGRTRHRKSLFSPKQSEPRGWGAPAPSQGPGKEGKKKRNKELLVLKEIPAGGGGPELLCALGEVSTKAAGAPPALWVNGCHQGHLGRRQSCLRRVVF